MPFDPVMRGLLDASGLALMIAPGNHAVVAASQGFLNRLEKEWDAVAGFPVHEVLPNTTDMPTDEFRDRLRTTLSRVETFGIDDMMVPRRVDLPGRDGARETGMWGARVRPVRVPEEGIAYLLYTIEDLTGMLSDETDSAAQELPRSISPESVMPEDFTGMVRVLNEHDRRLRSAERMLNLGAWEYDFRTRRTNWSRKVFDLYGLPHDQPAPDVESYVGMVHPDDRAAARANYERFEQGRDKTLVFQHRIQRPDGQVIHVHGVGERHETDGHEIIVGFVQDVSPVMEAQREIAELQARHAMTLEHISDAVFTLDHDWRFTFLNSQAERVLQRQRGNLLGRVVWDQFPEAINLKFREEYERAMKAEETARFTEYFPPLGKWFAVTAYPVPDGLAVYFRDVTEERAREERLRLLETAVEWQSDMVMITDAGPVDPPHSPRILWVNESFKRRTGYSSQEVIGKAPWLLSGPGLEQEGRAEIVQAMREERPFRGELRHYTKSGKRFWVEVDIAPLTDGHGRLTHWVSVHRDVTERKMAEREAQAERERFRLLTEASLDVIWDWHLDSGHLWWSDGLRRNFGHDTEPEGNRFDYWFEHVHPDDRERVLQSINLALNTTAETWVEEYRYIRNNGIYAVVLDRGYIERDAEGRARRMVGVMIDRTDQHTLEDRLRQAQKMEAVGRLTGGVAHDFNNLLTVILSNAAELAEQLSDDKELRLMAEMTATAAERGAELTNRLLAFSRRQALQPRDVDLNTLVRNFEPLARRTLPETIEIETVRGAGLWLSLVDPGQLETALLNLCINARDAMPDGGQLTIETANAFLDDDYAEQHVEIEPGQYVMLSVSDTGQGMDAETIARAFEPFFTKKEVGQGSGLGLSMVYGFAKQSGGHVKIYSELGEGTCVRLYFPRSNGTSQDREKIARPDTIVGGDEYILVAEDDPLLRDHLTQQLEGLGYRVTSCENGDDALAVIERTSEVDLLLTDIVMPGGMNGRELADRARAMRPGLKVLFTSGYTENAIVHHGQLDPGVKLLSKPYRLKVLAAKVREAIEAE